MDNPYRSYILPLARQQIGLMYAVLGLSASHLGKLTDSATLHDTTAVEYRLRAIRALSKEIRRSQSETLLEDEQDAVLAIIQILLLHDVSGTCRQPWEKWLTFVRLPKLECPVTEFISQGPCPFARGC